MADITKKIVFQADIDGLKDALRQIGPMLREFEQQLAIKIPLQGGLLNQYGQPYSGGGGAPPAPGMGDLSQMPAYQLLQMQAKGSIAGGATEQIRLKSIELDTSFKTLSKTISDFENQIDKLNKGELQQALTAKKDLEHVKKQQADIKNLGSGGGDWMGMVAASLPVIIKAVQVAAEVPMQRAAARAAIGQLGGRNIAAGMDLSNFENMARLDPEMQATARGSANVTGTVRGAGAGVGGAAIIGAGLGTALATLAAMGMAVPTGGMSLGALALLGAGGAAGGRGLFNIMTGNVGRQQAMTFEERMQSETGARAEEGARYNAAMRAHNTMFPIQQTYGWGVGATQRNLGGMANTVAKYSLSGEELSGMMQGGAGMMGGTLGSPGGGFDPNALNTMGRMQRGTGLGFGEIGNALGAFSGVGGNMGAGEQARNLEDIMARGTSRGVTTSPLMRSYLDVLTKVAGQAAGGWGSVNAGAAGAMVGTIMETTGEKFSQSVAGGAAAALGAMGKVETSTSGIAGWGNAIAADAVAQKLMAAGVNAKTAFAIGRMVMSATQQELSDPRTISRWARVAGVSIATMQGIVGSGMAQKLGMFSGTMGSLAGELGTDVGLTLMGETTVSAGLTADQWSGTQGQMRSGGIFEGGGRPGAYRTKKELDEFVAGGGTSNTSDDLFGMSAEGLVSRDPGEQDRAEAVSGVPGAQVSAVSLVDLLATAWSPDTLKEMSTHMFGLTTNLSKLNPQAETLATAFEILNGLIRDNIILNGGQLPETKVEKDIAVGTEAVKEAFANIDR